jgi:hypothetical protein
VALHAKRIETPENLLTRFPEIRIPIKIIIVDLSKIIAAGVTCELILAWVLRAGFRHCPNFTPMNTPAKATPSSKHLQQASAGSG